MQRYVATSVLHEQQLTKPDNNPMLRDGITGDWWAQQINHQHLQYISLTLAGLVRSSATKGQSGPLASRPTAKLPRQALPTLLCTQAPSPAPCLFSSMSNTSTAKFGMPTPANACTRSNTTTS